MTDPKPCGNYHQLSCGLDVDCRVPEEYFDAEKSDIQVWRDYKNDKQRHR